MGMEATANRQSTITFPPAGKWTRVTRESASYRASRWREAIHSPEELLLSRFISFSEWCPRYTAHARVYKSRLIYRLVNVSLHQMLWLNILYPATGWSFLAALVAGPGRYKLQRTSPRARKSHVSSFRIISSKRPSVRQDASWSNVNPRQRRHGSAP